MTATEKQHERRCIVLENAYRQRKKERGADRPDREGSPPTAQYRPAAPVDGAPLKKVAPGVPKPPLANDTHDWEASFHPSLSWR
jgi:hypothetical protein